VIGHHFKELEEMSKKYMKRGALSIALAVATMGSGSALAVGLPVIDAANLVVNEINKWANIGDLVVDFAILQEIRRLQPTEVLNHTTNIDESTANIDKSVTHIDESVTNIDKSITSIEKITSWNYDINKEFNYITNNYYGSDPVIIPTDVDAKFAEMLDKDKVEGYTSKYKSAEAYKDGIAKSENLTNVGVEATVMQKTANDALVKTLSSQRNSIREQGAVLEQLAKESVAPESQGHGKQLQYANALAGAQAAQLIQIREMMLASENARAAAVQAEADVKSRQVAASQSLRRSIAGGQGNISIGGSGIGESVNPTGRTY
jgi:conjugal transfer/entry exclusion protein